MIQKEKKISEKQAFSRMAHLCSQKEYSCFDISQKLFRLNFTSSEIENIVKNLVNENFLNEERFVRSYIGDKLKFNNWGKKKIEVALRQKKIPHEIIQKVFNEYSNYELNQLLESVLKKKWKSIKGATDNERRAKLIRYALGRGFEMKEVILCMQKLNLDYNDDD